MKHADWTWLRNGVMAACAMLLAVSWATLPAHAKASSGGGAVIRLCDPLSVCQGTSGGIIVTGNTLPALDFTDQGNGNKADGTAYLAILVPSTSASLSFTVNGSPAVQQSGTFSSGDLFSFIGQATAKNVGVEGGFQPFASNVLQNAGVNVTGFTVYLANLGSFTSGGSIPITLGGISGLPSGTVFWGYLVNNGVAVESTPYSEAVAIKGTTVPEPTSMGLMGTGLVFIGGFLRRRLHA